MIRFNRKKAKRFIISRALPMFLAAVMLFTSAPMTGISVGEGDSAGEDTYISNTPLKYDYDTLKITKDGDEVSELEIYSHEKIEVSGAGLNENAKYQWQIKHPEKNNLWVDIYDATEDNIGVSVALINNMMAEDGTAKLRLRAYTEDYAYLSNALTVKLVEEESDNTPTLSVNTVTAPSAMAGGDVSDDHPEFVTVTINYVRYDYYKNSDGDYVLDTSGTSAFTSYVATLLYGGDLENQRVVLPTIIGYNAFLCDHSTPDHSIDNNVGEIIKELTLNYTDITENITLQVDYLPADVDYSVRYFFQNIYDDLYVENTDEKVTTKGHTGSEPDEALMKEPFDGFTPLFHQPDTIAADGSTVFEVYYERNYYLMEFDCNGGYGVETLYVRYGSYISIPDPVKPGYVFAGWDLVKTDNPGNTEPMGTPTVDEHGNPTDFYTGDGHENIVYTEMPHYNTAYKALWDVSDTTYTVVYWAENANDAQYSYWGYQTFEAKSAQTRNGVAYGSNEDPVAEDSDGNKLQDISQMQGQTNYFTFSADLSDKNKLIEGNGSTIINVYYTRNIYTISFYANGKCAMTEHEHGDNGENCTIFICGYSHVHGPECVKGISPICGKTEHTAHTSECIDCGKQEHFAHTDACCTKDEHTHTVSCYTATQQTELNIRNVNPDNTDNMVKVSDYLYKQGTTYYLYLGGTINKNRYYRIDNATDNTQVILTCTTSHTHNRYCFTAYNYSTLTIANNPSTVNYVTQVSGNLYRSSYGNTYYVRVGDDYYRINNANAQTILSDCGKESHTHGDGSCTCGVEIHTHDDSCYKDELHTHTDACYKWSCGADSHVHTEKCCGQTEHKHTTNCTTSRRQTVYYITGKYGQDIKNHFYINGNDVSYKGYWWEVPDGSKFFEAGKYIIGIDSIPGENITFTGTDYSSYSEAKIHYYVEALEGEPYDLKYEGKYYVFYKTAYTVKRGYFTEKEEFHSIAGFTSGFSDGLYEPSGIFNSSSSVATDNYLYYLRNELTLRYYNHNDYLRDSSDNEITESLQYQALLTNYELTKAYMEANHYPSKLEPGAYEFGGWYTTAQCFDGTEVNWETDTMPDNDLVLYAKWTPILRNVTFYTDYNDIPIAPNPGGTPFLVATGVPHGSLLGTAYYEIPDKGGEYQFVGWFYMDENNKKRFAPDSMEITRDLVLFAEWQTGIDTEYEVQYKLGESATIGSTTYPAGTVIADTDSAHSSVGKTKTFNAKGAYQLYDGFRKSIFPTINSHSILMEPNKNDNTFVFEYVYDDQVYYKVRYVDYSTRSEIADFKIKVTDEAIVTEKFLPISGYMPMPHNYYITKALMTDGDSDGSTIEDENVITFYYIKDTEHGLYSIEYYVENLDSSGTEIKDTNYETITAQDYHLYQSIVNTGTLGDTITATIIPIDGYVYQTNFVITYETDGDPEKPTTQTPVTSGGVTTITGTDDLDYTGLSIKIYYKRITYPYVIKFVDSYSHDILGYGKLDAAGNIVTNTDGTPKVFESINDINTDKAKFEKTISYTAPATLSHDGSLYILNGDATKERKISAEEIPAGKTYNDLTNNVIVFYYNQKQVTVKYTAICKIPGATAFGKTSISSEIAATVSGLGGSEAIELDGYYFAGWYTNEACTNPVDPSWVTGMKMRPQELDQTKDVVEYYALFKPVSSSLLIEKTVYANDGTTKINPDDTFLFHIKGKDKFEFIDMIVSIQGSGSVTINEIPQGEYTITEFTGWSWEYDCTSASAYTITIGSAAASVTFTNKSNPSNWLNGETHEENVFYN